MTFKELKDFCNSLNEEQLNRHVKATEENDTKTIGGAEISEDLYINISDPEDRGTLEELKEFWTDEFNEKEYRLLPAGIPYLVIEF